MQARRSISIPWAASSTFRRRRPWPGSSNGAGSCGCRPRPSGHLRDQQLFGDQHADKKCRNLIRKLHRRNPQAIIAVTGCYAQLKPQEIAEIEGVDIVLSNSDKGELYKRVD